jgi:uncharacterized membrane protein YhdT
VAPIATAPLIVPVYRLMARRLPERDREVLRSRWGDRSYRTQAISIGSTALFLAVLNTVTMGNQGVPAWGWFAAWAITWPLLTATLMRWSIRLLARDPQTWRDLMTGTRTERTKVEAWRAAPLVFLALVPGVLLLAAARAAGP